MVAGWELHYVASSPQGGGGFMVLSYSSRTKYSMITPHQQQMPDTSYLKGTQDVVLAIYCCCNKCVKCVGKS